MKLLLHYPEWDNRWEPYVLDALREFNMMVTHTENTVELRDLSSQADILVSMWANPITHVWSHEFPEKKIVTYLRRYELWEPEFMKGINWEAVDKVIFVSKWCFKTAKLIWGELEVIPPADQRWIPNGIDFKDFPLRSEKADTKKIAIVCSMKEVKNIPLAFQILLELPKEYTLHHIGLPFSTRDTGQHMSYCDNLGLDDRFFTDLHIPRHEVFEWLSDKDYILSTSLNEGNPNNLIEAMSMGVKPIIHNWPGARDQFPEDLVFDRILGAVDLITGDSYNPQSYRDWVMSRYSLDNFKKLTATIKELC